MTLSQWQVARVGPVTLEAAGLSTVTTPDVQQRGARGSPRCARMLVTVWVPVPGWCGVGCGPSSASSVSADARTVLGTDNTSTAIQLRSFGHIVDADREPGEPSERSSDCQLGL